MLTSQQFDQFIEDLPRASHDMEHITNFGRIVAKGFVLIAETIDRCNSRMTERIVATLGGETNHEVIRTQRSKARAAKAARLEAELASLEAEAAAEESPAA